MTQRHKNRAKVTENNQSKNPSFESEALFNFRKNWKEI
jgi:hypothetical protein